MRRALFALLLAAMVLGAGWIPGRPVAKAAAPANGAMWQPLEAKSLEGVTPKFSVRPGFSTAYFLDERAMSAALAAAPLELTEAAKQIDATVLLPMPDGALQKFRVVESPIMEPALAREFPEIRTYVAQGIDDPTATARLDMTPLGFHAQVLSAGRTVYIDPYASGDTSRYISYDKDGLRRAGRKFECLVDDAKAVIDPELEKGPAMAYSNGGTLRTYRLAQACTGEYSTTICNLNGVAVTTANVMSAITTTINRVTGVYERELSTRLVLVSNNSTLVFLDGATDPYTNNNANSLLTQNQSTCDSRIGSANYDIGHVFSTGGGGLAGLGVVCNSTRKAQGETGSSSPRGDAFDIDYVAHEMGHQFSGNHTFIGTAGSCSGNGNSATAYERGSGSTIQAYAGICGTENLQPNSDDYFHTISLNEMTAYMAGGGNCSVNTSTGNSVPSLPTLASYTGIPTGTQFTLTAPSATDANGDAITYCWEDWNTGSAALFRPMEPTTSRSRTFGNVANATSGNIAWEVLPSSTTTKTFRCTVRDNRAGGGAFTSATMTVAFATGAHAVTAPNTAVSWAANSTQTVTWNKGGGTAATVAVQLSTDGGASWTSVLSSTANDGSEVITVPNTPSTTCRIRVVATLNGANGDSLQYFDDSDVNFSITSGGTCTFSISPTSASVAATSSTGSVGVTASTGCSWTATSNASWITITSGASGSGNGTVGYSVAANTGVARTGTMTIAGQSFTVNQAAGTTGCSSSTTAISSGQSLSGSLATTDCASTVRTGGTFYYDNFTFSATAGTQYTITLNSTAFDTYLYLLSGSTVLAQDDDGNGGTNSKIVYTPSTSGTLTIHCTSYTAGVTGAYTVALSGGGTVTLISEGAESGAAGWTVSTNVTGNNWVISANGRRTGSNGFRTNQATSTYPNNLDQSLISPAFSLAGRSSASLTYYYKRQTETSYDFFRVEVSTNGGTSWTSLSSTSGTSTGFTTTAGSGMIANTISLTPYVGNSNVKIRFRLTSDGSVVYWGVGLDDITVTAQ